jgi:hydrogenase/urease accessory protein HupE
MESRDLVAIAIVVGTFTALALKSLSPEQAVAIIMAILGYYFGYKQGYERGVSVGREKKA